MPKNSFMSPQSRIKSIFVRTESDINDYCRFVISLYLYVKKEKIFCCVGKSLYFCCKYKLRYDYDYELDELMNSNKVINKIEYVVCCVGAFASKFHLTNAQAYAYLRRFCGIDFLVDCYAAEHTLSIEDAVDDLTNICLKKGGKLV